MGLLTAFAVRSAKPGTSRREISDGQGLYLIVQPSGAKSWAFRYRNAQGKTCKLTIGSAERTSLEKARAAARKAATMVDEGIDPAVAKTTARQTQQDVKSHKTEDVVTAYIERHAKEKTRATTWREADRILNRQIISRFKGKPISSIETRHIHEILDAIMDQGSPAAALRTLYVMRPFFRWAIRRQIIATHPCEGVDPPSEPRPRERTLSDCELAAVWQAADGLGFPFGPIVHLLIVLGQRRDEVAGLRRSEIDLSASEWMLSAARAKNDKPNLIPLPPLAVSIIGKLPTIGGENDFMFTTTGRTAVSGFSKAKRNIDQRISDAGHNLQPWTLHDLRRSFATGCAGLGIAPHVLESLLNHRSGIIRGVAAIYNRYDYAKEKREALEKWARHIEKVTNSESDNPQSKDCTANRDVLAASGLP